MTALTDDDVRAPGRRAVVVGCALLLSGFAGLSWSSVSRKSPTFDEPIHAFNAWIRVHRADFRICVEDPPLWLDWASIPNGRDTLKADFDDPLWSEIAQNDNKEWRFTAETLYGTPGNDAASFINRSRAMMLVLGVALGAFIALWTWQLAGWWAALVAVFVFALDPGFLAHSPLVKGDVAFSLILFALAYVVWRMGRRLTAWNLVASSLLCGAGLAVKFSAGLLGPIVALLLVGRACSAEPWDVPGRSVTRRVAKLGVTAALLVVLATMSACVVWAAYDFRFSATADGTPINFQRRLDDMKQQQLAEQKSRDGWHPDRFTRAIVWSHDHRIMPEAWLSGLLFVRARSMFRDAYLLGEHRITGWWYYFPLAMLFKTPLATLLACVSALGAMVLLRASNAPWWKIVCLIVPPALYLAVLMSSTLNIGIRHVLPVYPFLFVAIGWVAAESLRRWRHRAAAFLTVIGLALAAETLYAFPDYIAFFNAAAGGSRGGLKLLGDSNLDWGQDLPLLALWQQQHRDRRLYLGYFGSVEPASYGIVYGSVPGSVYLSRPPVPIERPAVVAVSASLLQGVYTDPRFRGFYEDLLKQQPMEVLGGTIYLYDLP